MTVGPSLADFLRHERVPAGLMDRLDYIASPGPAGSWPPRPGCCEHRDIGIVRAWATIDLAAWLREAPQVFGPHRPHELEQLAAVGAQLRTTGEGAQVLWALDLITPVQWVDHPVPALAVSELITYGPRLSDSAVSAADAKLRAVGWAESTHEANQMCIINHVRCYETSWHGGESQSTRPAA
ncbi:MAG: hypothetical protein E6R06_25765 [Mycobacterium sp.]|nr:MAG: hypothetical protein E6R06_25765 [Mycobacterium sp.]